MVADKSLAPGGAEKAGAGRRAPLYQQLYVQVLVGIAAGVLVGHFWPALAIDMKPLGDAFIKLIKMIVGLIIFCTVVTGISGMESMKKVGRVGGRALIYFEVVSTLALAIGLLVGTVVRPGAGMGVDPATLDMGAVSAFAGQAQQHTVVEFLLNIIPNTVVDAFASGSILPIVFVSILLGYSLWALGESGKPLRDLTLSLSGLVFKATALIMKLAPIGAFGAMAFTIGRYGVSALGPLAGLVLTFWLTSIIFVVVVLGAIAWACGFSIFKLLNYIKDEILLVFGTSSSDSALPTLMLKLERLGCSKALVGLVVPTGYVFNTDGTSIYMTMATLFVAQATGTHLTFDQMAALFAVAMVTSKGASGVSGASFIALVGTLSVVPSIPVAGMALLLGVERFMSQGRAIVNTIGNAVATVVVAKWEGELDRATLAAALDAPPASLADPPSH